jgi:putative ABC transport system permease protein
MRKNGVGPLIEIPRIATDLGIRHMAPPTSVAESMARSIALPRFLMRLLSVFAAVALTLAGAGLFGTISYAVAQRTHEIGIRAALGATRGRVALEVIAPSLALALIATSAGLVLALWSSVLLRSQLHGVSPVDPLVFGFGAIVVMLTALIACVVPTRRASMIDPINAIRAE